MSVGDAFKKFTGSLKIRFQTYFHFLHEHKNARWFFGISLIIPVITIMVLVVILPLNIELPIEDLEVTNKLEFIPWDAAADSFMVLRKFSDVMFNLKMEELFLNSQLAMSKSDSIGLMLDVVDSTFALLIRGVVIRECRIHRFKMSYTFKHLKTDPRLFDWLSRPFVLQKNWATVPQVPIKIRKAPKDTIEAQKNKTEPVALDKPDVHYTLQFDRNLSINIHQSESNSFWGLLRKCYYDLRLYVRRLADTMVAFYHLKTPQGSFWIELTISQADALAIYRALPSQAELAVRLYFH